MMRPYYFYSPLGLDAWATLRAVGEELVEREPFVSADLRATYGRWEQPTPDWQCGFCGALNDPIVRKCPFCGAGKQYRIT